LRSPKPSFPFREVSVQICRLVLPAIASRPIEYMKRGILAGKTNHTAQI
jgi:hypothetical protein